MADRMEHGSQQVWRRRKRLFGWLTLVCFFAMVLVAIAIPNRLGGEPETWEAVSGILSGASFLLSLAAFMTSTIFAWRADRRAQAKHDWEMAEQKALHQKSETKD